MDLTEKYRPKSTDELIGNKHAIKELVKCIKECKPALLVGPPGIGKTSSVYAVANEYGYRVLEFNASDERKKEQLKRIISLSKMKGLVKYIILNGN